MEENDCVAQALKQGKQAYLQRRITSEASIGKILFGNGFKLAANLGLTTGRAATEGPDLREQRVQLLRNFKELSRRLDRIRLMALAEESTRQPPPGRKDKSCNSLAPRTPSFSTSKPGNNLTHVMGVNIYDPSTARGGKVRFKDIIAHVEGRLDCSPVFRRRLMRLPYDFDFPYWVEDEFFDIEHHMFHGRLPEPGDWRQFCIHLSRHFSRPMDMNRPLWDMYVIEGLDRIKGIPKGSYAIATRVHHAAIDGASAMHFFNAMSDKDRKGTPAIELRPVAKKAAGRTVHCYRAEPGGLEQHPVAGKNGEHPAAVFPGHLGHGSQELRAGRNAQQQSATDTFQPTGFTAQGLRCRDLQARRSQADQGQSRRRHHQRRGPRDQRRRPAQIPAASR